MRNTMKSENRVCHHPDLCGNRSQLQQRKVKLEKFNFHLDPSLIVLITMQSCICILNLFKCSTSSSKVILQVPSVLSLDTGSLTWSGTH